MRNARSSRRGSLVVVGAGIRLAAHVTAESLVCLQRAEKVFYLFFDPAAEAWIRRLNPAAETLQDCFADHKPRRKTYLDIANRLLTAVRSGLHVCAVCYGHPGVFAEPFHRSVRRAGREGYPSRMLPGISAEDCLFADLGVDPGRYGCQSFEATDFLAARRRFDPTSVLILWQVGVLGEPSIRPGMSCRPERLRVLTAFLRRSYQARHTVVLYEASYLPIGEPRIKRVPLARLPDETIIPLTTLYIPPLRARRDDPKIARWFQDVVAAEPKE